MPYNVVSGHNDISQPVTKNVVFTEYSSIVCRGAADFVDSNFPLQLAVQLLLITR